MEKQSIAAIQAAAKANQGSVTARKARQKGAQAERYLAKLFTEVTGFRFRRTPKSGGWDPNFSGDIICVAESVRFPWSVESKNQEQWDFSQLFEGTGPLQSWWDQTVRGAEKSQRVPLLIITRKNLPFFVVLRAEDVKSTTPKLLFRLSDERLIVLFRLIDFIPFVDEWARDARKEASHGPQKEGGKENQEEEDSHA